MALYIISVHAILVYMRVQEHNAMQDMLDQAIQAVGQETGVRLQVERKKNTPKDDLIDAWIQIKGTEHRFVVHIKKWIQQANLGALVNQVKQLPGEGMLVADHVNPKMAEKLRREGVQFIDTAGNAFINRPPVYVYVTGHRCEIPQAIPSPADARRAFEPTGLKLIFAFLCQPALVNAPYREIAEKAGVAVGTVGWVIKGLKAADFMRDNGKKQGRRLVNVKRLFDRWVEAYPEKLRPRQLLGEFITEDTNWWQGFGIQKYDGYWGGEIAAAIYTNYLKPQVATVYLNDTALPQFLGEARLRKVTQWLGDTPGTVKIYRPFWNETIIAPDTNKRKECVHPILAYADLVASGDPRNREVARTIYDKYLKKNKDVGMII